MISLNTCTDRQHIHHEALSNLKNEAVEKRLIIFTSKSQQQIILLVHPIYKKPKNIHHNITRGKRSNQIEEPMKVYPNIPSFKPLPHLVFLLWGRGDDTFSLPSLRKRGEAASPLPFIEAAPFELLYKNSPTPLLLPSSSSSSSNQYSITPSIFSKRHKTSSPRQKQGRQVLQGLESISV